jgi:hypothetical protein
LTPGQGIGIVAGGLNSGLVVQNVDASGRSIGFYGEGPTPGLTLVNSVFGGSTNWGAYLQDVDDALVLSSLAFTGSVNGLRIGSLLGLTTWVLPTTWTSLRWRTR